jgi:hypothetical protein
VQKKHDDMMISWMEGNDVQQRNTTARQWQAGGGGGLPWFGEKSDEREEALVGRWHL